jgi:hypothetical protein
LRVEDRNTQTTIEKTKEKIIMLIWLVYLCISRQELLFIWKLVVTFNLVFYYIWKPIHLTNVQTIAFRTSPILTDASPPLQTFNYRFKDLLDDFESYGLLDLFYYV